MIEKDIADAIEKNLPAVTAGVLKDRLEQLESLETEIKRLQGVLSSAISTQDDYLKQRDTKDERIKVLLAQLKTFEEREAFYKVSEELIRNAQLAQFVAQAELKGAMEVTRLVFGNIKLRERIYGTEPVAIPPALKDQYGGTQYGAVGQGSIDKTRETEV